LRCLFGNFIFPGQKKNGKNEVMTKKETETKRYESTTKTPGGAGPNVMGPIVRAVHF